jgi:DNA-binding NarL/FixJ family response regulator
MSPAEVLRALRLGARGIVLKDAVAGKLIGCIRKVSGGEQYLDSRLAATAADAALRREAGADEASRLLSPREVEMVQMVTSGLRNRHIAEKLGIAEGTVKVHLHKIYQKLEVRSRVELVLLAQSRGFI